MSEYKCKNGDVIRVGGVYNYEYDGQAYRHAVTNLNGRQIWGNDGYLMPEEISSELPCDEDGYYIWEGGECPVPDDWGVKVKGFAATDSANNWDWDKLTAFRVASTGAVHNPEPATKKKDKFSWNEKVPEIPYTGNGLEFKATFDAMKEASPMDVQEGGDHYKKMAIQPMTYSMANKLDACQHTIIKYVSRFRDKGGIEDLRKAKHCIDMLIKFETKALERGE